MMLGKRIVQANEKMPRGWGRAYYDFKMDRPIMEKVCYPVPINLIVGLSRRIYYAMVWGLSPSIFDREIHRRIKDGSDAQWDGGFECGKHEGMGEIDMIRRKLEALEKEYEIFKTNYHFSKEAN